MGASPGEIGPVKAITYRDGHLCRLTPPARLLAAEQAFTRKLRSQLHGRAGEARRQLVLQALGGFRASHHLTRAQFRAALHPTCPPFGYVRPNERVLNAAAASRARSESSCFAPKYGEFQIDITFIARQAVTSSRSWYEDDMTNPAGLQLQRTRRPDRVRKHPGWTIHPRPPPHWNVQGHVPRPHRIHAEQRSDQPRIRRRRHTRPRRLNCRRPIQFDDPLRPADIPQPRPARHAPSQPTFPLGRD